MAKPKFKFVPDDVRNLVIDECAKCVPTTWLDPLLTGPKAVGDMPARETEALLRAIQDRIRALKSA
jgi:hypothetical protein